MDKDYGFEHIIVSKTDTGLPCDLVLESSRIEKLLCGVQLLNSALNIYSNSISLLKNNTKQITPPLFIVKTRLYLHSYRKRLT